MRHFKYTAATIDGTAAEGEIVAADKNAMALDLGQRGLLLLSATELKRSDRGGFFSSPPSTRAVTSFLSELALMLRSGLPLDEALDLCARGAHSGLARVIKNVRTDVLSGASFVQALERHPEIFTRDIVAMSRVADATGDLDGVFAAVAAQRERTHRLWEKVTGALRYPAFLIVAAAGVLIFFLLVVIPQFAGLFADSGHDPGVLVNIVLALSNGLIQNEVPLAVGLAAVLGLGLVLARMPRARERLVSLFLKLPVINGTWQLWRTSSFLSSLSVLLGQGVSLTEAVKVLADPKSKGVAGGTALAAAGDIVRRGGRLHEALTEARVLPPVAIRMVRIGEETGELAKVTGEAGALYARQLEKRLDAISSLIGPVAIITIATLIGGLMVTIMSALISVDQAVF